MNKTLKNSAILCGVVILLAGIRMTPLGHSLELRIRGKKTVEDRLREYGFASDSRWQSAFAPAGVTYPPDRVVLIGIKDDRILEVHAAGRGGPWRLIATYPIRGMSGTIGPKLREGDNQVPEGVYLIASLNPNSLYHLSLRLNYPNDYDHARAKADGRTNLGGDIMIHGKSASIGCLAMGDEAAEDLFVLAARAGRRNVSVVIAPTDLRHKVAPQGPDLPAWTSELYENIKAEMIRIQSPTNASSVISTRGTPAAYAPAAPGFRSAHA